MCQSTVDVLIRSTGGYLVVKFLRRQKLYARMPITLVSFKGCLWLRKEVTAARGRSNSKNRKGVTGEMHWRLYPQELLLGLGKKEASGFPQLKEARASSEPMQGLGAMRHPCGAVLRHLEKSQLEHRQEIGRSLPLRVIMINRVICLPGNKRACLE